MRTASICKSRKDLDTLHYLLGRGMHKNLRHLQRVTQSQNMREFCILIKGGAGFQPTFFSRFFQQVFIFFIFVRKRGVGFGTDFCKNSAGRIFQNMGGYLKKKKAQETESRKNTSANQITLVLHVSVFLPLQTVSMFCFPLTMSQIALSPGFSCFGFCPTDTTRPVKIRAASRFCLS